MKIRYRQSGGFGGLVLGSDFDTQTMSPGEAGELERLVKQADLDKVGVKKSSRGRDLTNYEIVVEHHGATTRAAVDDMTMPPQVEPLLNFLKDRASAKPIDD
jgi:superfamily II helicase